MIRPQPYLHRFESVGSEGDLHGPTRPHEFVKLMEKIIIVLEPFKRRLVRQKLVPHLEFGGATALSAFAVGPCDLRVFLA